MTKRKFYSMKVLSILFTCIMAISIVPLGMCTVSAVEMDTYSTAAGDSIANATSLGLSSTVNGSITVTNKQDFYRISVPNNSSIEYYLTLTSYMTWVYLKVYNISGDEIISKNPSWNSNIYQVTETYTIYLDPGTYYIGIIQDGSNTGNYTLSSSYQNLNNIDIRYDDTIANAYSLDLTKSFTGVLTNDENSDIYKLNVTNPGILNCEFYAYMKWIYLKLIDSQGNEIISRNPSWNSNIGYSVNNYSFALEKGIYYLQILSDGDNRGKYQFVNKFTVIGSTESEKNDTIVTANTVSLGKNIIGLLGEDEESDIYKITIPSSGTVNVNLKAFMKWIYLRIYTISGDEIYSQNPSWNSNLSYSNNDYEYTLTAGTYYFQIKNDGDNRGKYILRIVQPKVLRSSTTKISSISTKVFSGKYITPSVTVKYGSTKLKQGTDYSVSYSDNYYVGTATVTITGKGDYTGTVHKTFKIIPKAVKLKSLKNVKKKSLVVKWSKNSNVSGYRILYATNKKFKNAKKYITSWSSTTSATLYNLKKNKTYYVKVQAYNWSEGKKVYSKYSAVKSKRISK